MIAEDEIDLGHVRECVGLGLRGAAGDDDARVGVFAARAADRLPRLAHGFGGDGAGVDEDRVGEPGLFGALLASRRTRRCSGGSRR